jgi:ferredoxin
MSQPENEPDIAVSVDPECCQGAQRCTYLAPGAFLLDDAGLLARPADPFPLTDVETVVRVASGCPNSAIIVHLAGKQIYP